MSKAESKVTSKNAEKTQAKKTGRKYDGHGEIDHDLFKLTLTGMKKNIGVDGDGFAADYQNVPHIHFFHTVDSDGRKQLRAQPIGGHTHAMQLVEGEDGEVPTVTCGPAVREVRKKINGKFVKVYEPVKFRDGEVDDHTHDVEYVKSDRISLRKQRAEAVNIIAQEAQKTAPIPGIIG